jgi:hypothetical protein
MSKPTELNGNEAVRYAAEHLREVRTDAEAWTTEYVDDATGEEWIWDYPQSELHGGGPPRLRRLVDPARR